MKKEYILSDEEKNQKRQKIEENRRNKKGTNSAPQTPGGANAFPDHLEQTPGPPEALNYSDDSSQATVLMTERGERIVVQSTPASPAAFQSDLNGERPQARVLPSTRTGHNPLEGPSRAKVESTLITRVKKNLKSF